MTIKKIRIRAAHLEIIDKAYTLHKSSETKPAGYWEGIAAGAVDIAIDLHREKISAALRRAGCDVSGSEIGFDQDFIVAVINKKTGLELQSLAPDDIETAMRGRLKGMIEELIGYDIDEGFDGTVEGAIEALAMQAVKSGRVNNVIGDRVAGRIKIGKVVAAAGVSEADVEAAKNAQRQRKYRARNTFIWI
jgi:hypothetical protein